MKVKSFRLCPRRSVYRCRAHQSLVQNKAKMRKHKILKKINEIK